ncbi:MAG: copper resistance CopC/CopD family protein [Acidimicrobiales bacterium]
MTLRRALLAASVGALALVGILATPAAAHATLVSIDPADGARLDQSPEVVRLTFSERVSVELGGVRVLSADGDPVQDGTAHADGTEVVVDLQPDLPDGTYVVSYRVVSADGHPVRGGSVFGVGEGEVDTGALGRVAGTSGDRTWEVVGAIGRGFAYAGVLLAAGGTAFLVLVHGGGAERRSLVRTVGAAAVVGGIASLVALPVQAALGTGQGPGSLFDPGVLGEVTKDGVGLSLLLAVAGLLVATTALARAPVVALVGAAVAAGSFAATGHTRAGSNATLATVADVTHLWVTAVWAGGVVLLLLVLRSRRAEADRADTIGLVGRFSNVATVSILLVGVTGVTLAWTEVRTLHALTSTGYGRLLIAKVVLVAWVAVLGAYNHFRLVPALTRGKAAAALTQLWGTLRLEVLTLVVVVALTSVLVVVTPARSSAEGGVVERIVELEDVGSVQVTVAPAQAGFNQIHLYLFDPDGRPAEIAQEVSLVMTLPSAGLGPITRDAFRAGPAHFQLDTDDLAVAGTWTLEVQARVDRFTQVTGSAEVPIAS